MNISKFIKASMVLALAAIAAPHTYATATLGYSIRTPQRDHAFRVGSTEAQGMAMRLGPEKIKLLAGRSITGVCTALGSRQTTDRVINIFVATTPGGTPLISKTVEITSPIKWLEFQFDGAYTITGDEPELYVGYTTSISVQSSVLMADRTADIAGCCYLLNDGEWQDSYGLGFGCPMVAAQIDGDAPITDLIIKPIAIEGYYKAEESYTLRAQVLNFGTEAVKGLKLNVDLGDGKYHNDCTLADAEIAPASVYDIDLPALSYSENGSAAFSFEASLTGASDADSSDNLQTGSIYFYPADMERGFLLEGFTGQACHNCPTGHAYFNSFIESVGEENIVEVMHHAGYMPDLFTMEYDAYYLYFYGSNSTYAPAFMMNRTQVPGVAAYPVAGVSESTLSSAYEYLQLTQPYASLSLESSYNPATRQVDIDLNVLTHNDMPEGVNVLNVLLVQDDLLSYQLPYGDGYRHNCVFRGVLTGNPWGLTLNEASTKAGSVANWKTSFTLPTSIFSDYYDKSALSEEEIQAYDWATDPENMRIVAYIGSYGATPNDHRVYNAVQTGLGTSHVQKGFAGISPVSALDRQAPEIFVTGRRIAVVGDYDSLSAYRMDGRPVSPAAELTPGLYIVRATKGNKATVKKVLVK